MLFDSPFQGRTLSTNPMSRLTTMNGRMAVLRRLLTFLELALAAADGPVLSTRNALGAVPAVTVPMLEHAGDQPHIALYASDFHLGACAPVAAEDPLAPTAAASASTDTDTAVLSPAALLHFATRDLLPVLVRQNGPKKGQTEKVKTAETDRKKIVVLLCPFRAQLVFSVSFGC